MAEQVSLQWQTPHAEDMQEDRIGLKTVYPVRNTRSVKLSN